MAFGTGKPGRARIREGRREQGAVRLGAQRVLPWIGREAETYPAWPESPAAKAGRRIQTGRVRQGGRLGRTGPDPSGVWGLGKLTWGRSAQDRRSRARKKRGKVRGSSAERVGSSHGLGRRRRPCEPCSCWCRVLCPCGPRPAFRRARREGVWKRSEAPGPSPREPDGPAGTSHFWFPRFFSSRTMRSATISVATRVRRRARAS